MYSNPRWQGYKYHFSEIKRAQGVQYVQFQCSYLHCSHVAAVHLLRLGIRSLNLSRDKRACVPPAVLFPGSPEPGDTHAGRPGGGRRQPRRRPSALQLPRPRHQGRGHGGHRRSGVKKRSVSILPCTRRRIILRLHSSSLMYYLFCKNILTHEIC